MRPKREIKKKALGDEFVEPTALNLRQSEKSSGSRRRDTPPFASRR